MTKSIFSTFFIVCLLGLGLVTSSFAGLGSKNELLTFDGIWVNTTSNSTMLVTLFKNKATIHGKDSGSTWSSEGTVSGKQLVNQGTGINKSTASGTTFIYSSTLTLNTNGSMTEKWKAIDVNGKELKGVEVFTKKTTGVSR